MSAPTGLYFWIEKSKSRIYKRGLILFGIYVGLYAVFLDLFGFDEVSIIMILTAFPFGLVGCGFLLFGALLSSYQFLYEFLSMDVTDSHLAIKYAELGYSMGAKSAEEEELFVNISNKLTEYNFHDLKKLATGLNLDFESDCPPEDYGVGPIIDSEVWQKMVAEMDMDQKMMESLDQFYSAEIDKDLERLATEHGIVQNKVKKERYIGQNKCDLIAAIIDAQNPGGSKEERYKSLQREIEQENKISAKNKHEDENELIADSEAWKILDDVILGSGRSYACRGCGRKNRVLGNSLDLCDSCEEHSDY